MRARSPRDQKKGVIKWQIAYSGLAFVKLKELQRHRFPDLITVLLTVKDQVPDAGTSRDPHGPVEKGLSGKARVGIGVSGFGEWNDGHVKLLLLMIVFDYYDFLPIWWGTKMWLLYLANW